MRKILYLLLGLVSVPAVSLMSDPNPLAEPGLGYVATASSTDLDLNDQEIDEAISKEIYAVEDGDDDSEEDNEASLAGSDSPSVTPEKQKGEVKNWRDTLGPEDKKLFRRIIKRRKEKKSKGGKLPKLTLEKAKELLARAQERKKKLDKNN